MPAAGLDALEFSDRCGGQCVGLGEQDGVAEHRAGQTVGEVASVDDDDVVVVECLR